MTRKFRMGTVAVAISVALRSVATSAAISTAAAAAATVSAALILAGCADLAARSEPGVETSKTERGVLTLDVGDARLLETRPDGRLSPRAPRLLRASHRPAGMGLTESDFAASAQQGEPVAQLVLRRDGLGVRIFAPRDVVDVSLFPTGPFSAGFAQCALAPVTDTLVDALAQASESEVDAEEIAQTRAVLARLSSCALRDVLSCVSSHLTRVRDADAPTPWTSFDAGEAVEACLPAGGKAGTSSNDPTFEIAGTTLRFAPSPVYAISIYEGDLPDYDTALTDLVPAATVPADASCPSLQEGCIASPLPLARCVGCGSLRKGVVHTAFLLPKARVRRGEVLRAVFRP